MVLGVKCTLKGLKGSGINSSPARMEASLPVIYFSGPGCNLVSQGSLLRTTSSIPGVQVCAPLLLIVHEMAYPDFVTSSLGGKTRFKLNGVGEHYYQIIADLR